MSELGKFLFVTGLVITLLGLLFWTGLVPRRLGRLPGDIRIERGNSAYHFPIVTCIVVSMVLSLIFFFSAAELHPIRRISMIRLLRHLVRKQDLAWHNLPRMSGSGPPKIH